jgi:hypothetical protein
LRKRLKLSSARLPNPIPGSRTIAAFRDSRLDGCAHRSFKVPANLLDRVLHGWLQMEFLPSPAAVHQDHAGAISFHDFRHCRIKAKGADVIHNLRADGKATAGDT